MLKEEILVDQSQEINNSQAPSLAEAYQQIHPKLIRILGKNTVNEMAGYTPEDVIQQAALLLLPHWDGYMEKDGSNPQGLFVKTSLRLQKDAGRKRRRNTNDEPHDMTELVVRDELAEQPFREVERDNKSISHLCATAGLSAREAKMVRMRYINGVSQAQIASYFGIKIGTVKSRLNRSLEKLRSYATKKGITRASLDLFDLD